MPSARFQRILKGEPVLVITGCDRNIGLKFKRTAESQRLSAPRPTAIRSAKKTLREALATLGRSSNDSLHPQPPIPRHRADCEQFYRRVEASGDVVEGRSRLVLRGLREFRDDALGA